MIAEICWGYLRILGNAHPLFVFYQAMTSGTHHPLNELIREELLRAMH